MQFGHTDSVDKRVSPRFEMVFLGVTIALLSIDATEKALTAIAADGSALLDPTLDPFAAIAGAQPAFADWRKKRMERTQLVPDGKTPHATLALALAEVLSRRSCRATSMRLLA